MEVTELHAPSWKRLQQRRDRLPQALLLTGTRGIGKLALARQFVEGLLCEKEREDGTRCGACPACNWLDQGYHPDLRLVHPAAFNAENSAEASSETKKKGSEQITIDQIRALDEFIRIGTHRHGHRVILIHPAEAMNRSAANALLKMLEEPPAATLFLLVSSAPARLLPTVKSRCQVVSVPTPDQKPATAWLAAQSVDSAEKWLALAGGAPLLAASLARSRSGELVDLLAGIFVHESDRFLFIAELEKKLRDQAGADDSDGLNGLQQTVEWLQKWTVDLTLTSSGLQPRYFIWLKRELCLLSARTDRYKLFRLHRTLSEKKAFSSQPLNMRLFLEDLLYSYQDLFDNIET